jgi:hypothetical protein
MVMLVPPYFVGELKFHCEPEDDYVMFVDETLGFIDSKGEKAEAPKGLVTDGVSVRQLLDILVIGLLTRLILSGDEFDGPFRWPAVVHDGEYGAAKERTFWAALFSRARAAADRRIREGAMAKFVAIRKVAGVCQCSVCVEVHERKPAKCWQAWAVWALLRVFGFKAWMDDSTKAAKSLAKIAQPLK